MSLIPRRQVGFNNYKKNRIRTYLTIIRKRHDSYHIKPVTKEKGTLTKEA